MLGTFVRIYYLGYIGVPHATRKKFQIRFLLFVLYLHYFDDYEPSYFKFFRTGENFKFKNEIISN